MSDLPCFRCGALIPWEFAVERQPMDVEVACLAATCGWRGKAYQCVPGHRSIRYDAFRNQPCVLCGEHNLSWNIDAPRTAGLVTCNSPECGWWAEVT